jgi:outer membrane protein assembly factor BamB
MKHQNSTVKTNLQWRRYVIYISFICFVVLEIAYCIANAGDWTTYRYDRARSGITAEKVATPLSLRWTFKPTHAPKPAWPKPAEELPRMHLDSAYHVTVANDIVYFGSSVDNKVYALDAKTGEVRWTFFTEGPVRFAPSIWKDRIYVGSDDGNVYCLKAKDGRLVWKYRAGPSAEKVIGNGRMISLWPVRTSVLVDDGVAYFGAGVFPYEGIYICALNANDGTVIWKNDTIGDHSHELDYGGISPQSYLVASENILYVPSGRAMPAAFDKKTGQFLRYLSAGQSGGVWTLISEGELIAGVDTSGSPSKVAFDEKTGKRKGYLYAWFPGLDMVATTEISYTLTQNGINAIARVAYPHLNEKLNAMKEDQQKTATLLADLKVKLNKVDKKMRDEVNKQIDKATRKINDLAAKEAEILKYVACKWQYAKKNLYSLILAGDVIFAGGEGVVVAVNAKTGKELWSNEVDGKAYGFAVSNGRLFVSTDKGNIYCFGEQNGTEPNVIKVEIDESPYPDDKLTPIYEAAVETILKETGIKKGYCLVLDSGIGRLAFEIAKRTDMMIVGIENSPNKVKKAKKALDSAGLYGSRIVVEQWDLSNLPNYFANLIVSDAAIASGKAKGWSGEMFRVLRPYGGVGYILNTSSWRPGLDDICRTQKSSIKHLSMLIRGELKGAGSWTEGYANPQNTACSGDELVKSPLGVLWFGEPGPEKMVERHAKAVSPVSMNGRLFIQGEEVIMAYDAYNGAFLWERKIPGAVRARADVDGGNLALTENALYVAAHEKCYCLDPATGETVREFEIPRTSDSSGGASAPACRWGYLSYTNNILYGSRAMPLNRDYFALWKTLVETGKWVDINKIPVEYRNYYNSYTSRYPAPGEELLAEFKRSGGLWALMADFPMWEMYNSSKGAVTKKMMVSDMIFAMNPETGKLLWKHNGNRIAHITVTIGDGKIFFAESVASKERAIEYRQELIRRGIYEEAEGAVAYKDADVRTVICLNAVTGRKVWEKTLDLTGCGGDGMGTAYHDGVLLFFGNMGNHDAWRHKNGTLRWKRITALSAENGDVLWSKPNNYRTRPIVVGDEIFIEPRVCDVHTGKIKMRTHPITGKQVPWEYLRPGHTCAISSASANMLFYRSYCNGIYDFAEDRGVTIFGSIRPGCWISMIPASGLLLSPEASVGCTCSFPLRASVVLTHKPERTQPWNVFITHDMTNTAKNFFINFGAPGDMKDKEGNVWFAYPNPVTRYAGNHYPDYGVKFDLHEKFLSEGMGRFDSDIKSATIKGTDKPWLFTSGFVGISKFNVPLIDEIWEEEGGVYNVQLGFAAQPGDRKGQRVFDVKLQGNVVLKNFDIFKEAGAANKAVVKEFKGIKVENDLVVEFVPKVPNPKGTQAPIVNFVKAVREDVDKIAKAPEPVKPGIVAETGLKLNLKSTEVKLAKGNYEEALALYHSVFDAASSVEIKQKALEGMATIGSPKSLSRIVRYCKDISPILLDYRDIDPEIKNGAIKTYMAIANNTVNNNKPKGIKMLNYALTIANSLEIQQKVVASLENLNVKVDADAAKAGFITRWHLIGPFPWDSKENTLSKVFVGEPNVNTSGAYKVGDKILKWKEYVSYQAQNLLENLFVPNTNVAAYAYAEVVLTEEQKLLLKVGSDEGFKCWFNGEVVGRFDGSRAWKADENVLQVKGEKGVNQVLLKISQSSSGWSFSTKLTDMNGKVVMR